MMNIGHFYPLSFHTFVCLTTLEPTGTRHGNQGSTTPTPFVNGGGRIELISFQMLIWFDRGKCWFLWYGSFGESADLQPFDLETFFNFCR